MDGPKPLGHWSSRIAPNSGSVHGFLHPGRRYHVVRPFVDFDGDVHPVGESWTFRGYSFLPYDDGLSLFVSTSGDEWLIRLRHRPGAQAAIIENLSDYIQTADRDDITDVWDVINKTAAAYADWREPWRFRHAVSEALRLPEAKNIFQGVWQEAVSDRHWAGPDTASSTSDIANALEELFPRLDRAASEQIVRAAAYEWR